MDFLKGMNNPKKATLPPTNDYFTHRPITTIIMLIICSIILVIRYIFTIFDNIVYCLNKLIDYLMNRKYIVKQGIKCNHCKNVVKKVSQYRCSHGKRKWLNICIDCDNKNCECGESHWTHSGIHEVTKVPT